MCCFLSRPLSSFFVVSICNCVSLSDFLKHELIGNYCILVAIQMVYFFKIQAIECDEYINHINCDRT